MLFIHKIRNDNRSIQLKRDLDAPDPAHQPFTLVKVELGYNERNCWNGAAVCGGRFVRMGRIHPLHPFILNSVEG